jgi:hypothetical protein
MKFPLLQMATPLGLAIFSATAVFSSCGGHDSVKTPTVQPGQPCWQSVGSDGKPAGRQFHMSAEIAHGLGGYVEVPCK